MSNYNCIFGSIKWLDRKTNKDRIYILDYQRFSLFRLFDGVSSSWKAVTAINKIKKFLRLHRNNNFNIKRLNLSELCFDLNNYLINQNIIGWYTTYAVICIYDNMEITYSSLWDTAIYLDMQNSLDLIVKLDHDNINHNLITKCLGMELPNHCFYEKNMKWIRDFNGILICTDWFYSVMNKNKWAFHKSLKYTYGFNKKRSIDNLLISRSDDASYIYIYWN